MHLKFCFSLENFFLSSLFLCPLSSPFLPLSKLCNAVFPFERLGKREHVCESSGQLPCMGASEIKVKGQMTSAPDKCVDLIKAWALGA